MFRDRFWLFHTPSNPSSSDSLFEKTDMFRCLEEIFGGGAGRNRPGHDFCFGFLFDIDSRVMMFDIDEVILMM